jgi:O-antigen ligase
MEGRKRIKEKKEIKYLFALSLALIVMAVSLAIIFQPLLRSRLSGTDRLEVKSNTQRVNSLTESWQIITKHESLGVGLGNYLPAIYHAKPNLPGWSYEPAHNIYLLIWAELGGFGLIVFFTIYVLIFVRSWRQKNYLFLSLILCLGIAGLFDHYFWTQYVGLILWWLSWFLGVNLDKD